MPKTFGDISFKPLQYVSQIFVAIAKIPLKDILKKEGFTFGPPFRSWVLGHLACHCGPEVKQNIMAEKT